MQTDAFYAGLRHPLPFPDGSFQYPVLIHDVIFEGNKETQWAFNFMLFSAEVAPFASLRVIYSSTKTLKDNASSSIIDGGFPLGWSS